MGFFQGKEKEFNMLRAEEQEILYLQDRKKFENEAANSRWSDVRRLVMASRETSPDTLDGMFERQMKGYQLYEEIRLIIENPNFQMNDEKRKKMSKSDDWRIRIIPAGDKESSSGFLYQMLKNEIEDSDYSEIIEEIVQNPNFKMNGNARNLLAKSNNYHIREIPAKDEKSSLQFLKKMLKNEIEGKDDVDIEKLIIENPNFKMDDDSRNLLAKSKNSEIRNIPAKDEKSSLQFLKKMLKNEVEGDDDKNVEDLIIKNPNFKMDNDSRNLLAKSKNSEIRNIPAKDEESSSEFLNQMLKDEIKSDCFSDVIETIINNANFKMEDQTRETLAKAEKAEYRRVAANSKGASIEFLENMYLEEDDENVIKVIERSIMKKRIIQKQQISKELKEFKDSNTSAQECLYRILEIIC